MFTFLCNEKNKQSCLSHEPKHHNYLTGFFSSPCSVVISLPGGVCVWGEDHYDINRNDNNVINNENGTM